MKLPFPFKPTQQEQPPQSTWPWPSCGNSTKTLSFRAPTTTTINSANESEMGTSTTTQMDTESVNLVNDSEDDSVIQGVMRRRQSERLFFTPGETNSILEEAKSKTNQTTPDNINKNGFSLIIKENSVVMEEMESTNPYVDFKKSMEEMVEANQGLRESMEGLQEMLSCYLTVNGKSNHGYIIGAFVDLLVSLSFANHHNHDSNSSPSNSPVSALSFSSNSSSSCTSSTTRSTTPACSIEEEEGDDDHTSTSHDDHKTLVVVDALDNNSSSSSSSSSQV